MACLASAIATPAACAFGITPFGPIIAYEVIGVAMGVAEDVRHGTTRNTSEAVVGALGATAGAIGGAVAGAGVGATIGTFACPGPGTLVGAGVGATVGATMGGVYMDNFCRREASDIFDRYDYNIQEFVCTNCSRQFKCRVYTDQSQTLCMFCDVNTQTQYATRS